MKKTKTIIKLKILSSILNLFRRQEQPKKDNENIPTNDFAEIEKLFEDFRNRPIHQILTEDIINTTPDSSLIQVVFDNLQKKVSLTYDKEYETVLSWNKSRQALYII